MSWASPQDIIDRWVGSDIPTDTDLLTALIADAESVILGTYPGIQTRIDNNELSLSTVTMVVARMVTRLLRNPEGLTYWQQQTGPFGQARNYGSSGQDIWMSPEEVGILAPVRAGKAYEVNQGYNATSGSSEDMIWVQVR
jgi:hypothetical protein